MSTTVLHTTPDNAPHLEPTEQAADTPTLLAELRALPQWVSFRVIPDPNGGKAKKRAYTPGTSHLAKSNDSDTWGTFEAARADVEAGRAGYVGFVPTADDPYAVVDWDDCLDLKTGAFTDPNVEAEVMSCPGYKERSQSKSGIHAVIRGVRPGSRKRTGNFECYDEGQMMVFTFDVVDGHSTIRNGQRWLTEVYNQRFPTETPRQQPRPAPSDPTSVSNAGERPTNERILEVAFGLRNGEKLRRLHEGDTSDYNNDESRADAALAAMWCPFTPDDGEIEDLMRASALARPKWDRRGDNYLARTIKFARKKQSWWWDWDRKTQRHIVDGIDQETGEILEPRESPEPAVPVDCSEAVDHYRQENTRLRQENRQLRADNRMLIAFVLNPNIKAADKIATASVLDLVFRKPVDADGNVALKAGEISNDWRKKPEPGENTAPLNPDGSKPRLSRGSVPRVMRKLAGIDDEENPSPRLIEATPDIREVKAKGRDPWNETIWLVKKPTSMAEFLAPIATHDPEQKSVRKARTIPCPECNEVHPVSIQMIRRTTCLGCGHTWEDKSKPKTVQPIVEIYPDESAAAMGDQRSPVGGVSNTTGDQLSPKGPPPTPLRFEPTLADRFAAGGWE